MSTPDSAPSGRVKLHSGTSEIVLEEGPVGRDLGKYRVLLELARGGMGVVSLAVLRGPGGFHKLLAVKELRTEFVRTPALVAMFIDEARLAARLSHPNVVQTIEVGVQDDRPFMAMEYLDGQPLRQVVQRALALSMRIPLRAHVGILLEVLSALDYAHSLTDFDGKPLGVVHRDVSPHNVVLTYDGQVKLIDFGSSKAGRAQHDGGDGRAEFIMGKARYMSPEQASGGTVDQRADLFAVGVMMWEAIVGKRPWEGQSDAVVLQNLASGALPRMRDAWPDVDPGLGAIVDRAMCANPDDRYPTAHDMRTDLERYIGSRNLAPQSTRSLGASVARLFVDDREKLRATVDAKIRALGAGDLARSSSIPRMAMTLPAVGSAASAEVPGEHPRPPAVPPPITLTTPSARRDMAPSAAPASVPPLVVHAPSRTILRETRRGVAAVALAAAAVGAAIALVCVSVPRIRASASEAGGAPRASQGSSPTTAASTPSAPVPLAPPAPPLPAVLVAATSGTGRTTHTIVVASPPAARIYLDEAAVSNPYVADHGEDSTAHRLRVEAPGFETKNRVITFAEDVRLELELTPMPPPPAWHGPKVDRSAPPEPPPPRAAPVAKTSEPRGPKPIETGDPYLR